MREEAKNVSHSKGNWHTILKKLRNHLDVNLKEQRLAAATNALDRLIPLVETERNKLFPIPKNAKIRCRVEDRKTVLRTLLNSDYYCYYDRFESTWESEQPSGTY